MGTSDRTEISESLCCWLTSSWFALLAHIHILLACNPIYRLWQVLEQEKFELRQRLEYKSSECEASTVELSGDILRTQVNKFILSAWWKDNWPFAHRTFNSFKDDFSQFEVCPDPMFLCE